VLSKNSIESSWIEGEVEAALERERKQKTPVVFPIRLDDAAMTTGLPWAVEMRRTRHIEDMTGWEDESRFQERLGDLMRIFGGTTATP
jgi:hypothetical protein